VTVGRSSRRTLNAYGVSRQNLEGDIAASACVAGTIELADAACTNECDDFIAAEVNTRREGHGL
jgi:hypothetical protein